MFGAAYNGEFETEHVEISDKDNILRLMGSKYTQSRIKNAYEKAKQYLKNGRIVLFTGTPCQIGGLKAYLKKDYENLITQDLICHGAPSPVVWEKYIKYRETISDSKVKRISQRDKTNGWEKYGTRFEFKDGTVYCETLKKDVFMKGFLSDLYLRPSCYNCDFKSLERESDITLADFWGVKNLKPKYFDDKGASLVFVNSAKGEEILSAVKDNLIFERTDLHEAVKHNTAAYKSCEMPSLRKKIMKSINKENFFEIVDKTTGPSFLRKVKRITKNVLNVGK